MATHTVLSALYTSLLLSPSASSSRPRFLTCEQHGLFAEEAFRESSALFLCIPVATPEYMDPSEPRPSPRRELQGPRPTPLKVSKESHKIKKPPAPSHPVVIYAISPKIIHVEPGEFMTLVQRLTGPDSSAADASLPSPTGALSPAARIATFESSAPPRAGDRARGYDTDLAEMEGWQTLDRTASFPGILSPVPWALPPISPKLFSPSFDPSVFSILQELSPVFGGRGGTFLGSPSNSFLSTPLVPSPGACWDLLSQLPDF